MDTRAQEFAALAKQTIAELGTTAQELLNEAGVSRQSMYAWKAGLRGIPSRAYRHMTETMIEALQRRITDLENSKKETDKRINRAVRLINDIKRFDSRVRSVK